MRLDELLDHPNDPRARAVVKALGALFRGELDDEGLVAWAALRNEERERAGALALAGRGWRAWETSASRLDGVQVQQDHAGVWGGGKPRTLPPPWFATFKSRSGGADAAHELLGTSSLQEAIAACDAKFPMPAWWETVR